MPRGLSRVSPSCLAAMAAPFQLHLRSSVTRGGIGSGRVAASFGPPANWPTGNALVHQRWFGKVIGLTWKGQGAHFRHPHRSSPSGQRPHAGFGWDTWNGGRGYLGKRTEGSTAPTGKTPRARMERGGRYSTHIGKECRRCRAVC